MLQNWLQPIDYQTEDFEKDQLGSKVHFHNSDFPKLQKLKVALLGLEEEAMLAIRDALYDLSGAFPQLKLADIGNLRKTDLNFITPVFKELLEGDLMPIILGGKPDWTKAMLNAYFQTKVAAVHWLAINDRIRLEKGYQTTFYTLLGGQAHHTYRSEKQRLEKKGWDYISLGQVRSDMKEVEPSIRDADLITIHLAAMKYTETPSQLNPSPSGFFLEEACQLARYAGMSDKLTAFGITGFNLAATDLQTAQSIAQMIWYFLDGFCSRKQDYPVSTSNLVQYVVHLKEQDLHLAFWKSLKSGRWWFQLNEHQHLIPCSYQDYKQASRGELSDRLLNNLER